MTITYSGVTDLEVIERMITLIRKRQVVTVKLTKLYDSLRRKPTTLVVG